jgi:UDP-N-acetyl-2-amino-2-deoxyglucuronate dehydrogenase
MRAVRGVGVVGTGLIYERHARACADMPDRARLVAVADVDPDRLAAVAAAWPGTAPCRDHRELVARDDVDIVVVCTPPFLHEEIVVDALEAGKHVLCEKPLAHTLPAADRIAEVAARHPGRLSVVHQFRYLPEVQRAIWLRDTGRLGPLLFGRFSRHAKLKAGRRREWWGRWGVAGGGAVMTQLIHELDLMCHVFGEPVEVTAMMDTLKAPIESEDTCAAIVRFASGALVSVTGTMCAHRSAHGFDVMGRDGTAHAPWAFHDMDKAAAARTAAAAVELVPDAGDDPETAAHTPYMAAVLDAIDAGEPLPIGAQEGRRAVELCAGIYASAMAGAPVTLPLDPDNPWYGGPSAEDYALRGSAVVELAR